MRKDLGLSISPGFHTVHYRVTQDWTFQKSGSLPTGCAQVEVQHPLGLDDDVLVGRFFMEALPTCPVYTNCVKWPLLVPLCVCCTLSHA